MANSKGPSSVKNTMYNGKHSLLPPKSPFPSISPSYLDYVQTSAIGVKGLPKPREGYAHHQRTSSESMLIEDQPSWLDELLNEPETPVRKGHRRSSSDSFTYMEVANANMNYATQDEYRSRNMASFPSRASQDFDYYKDARRDSFYQNVNPLGKSKSKVWDPPSNSLAHPSGPLSVRDNYGLQNSVSTFSSQETDGFQSNSTEKQHPIQSGPYDAKASSERNDSSCAKASASETDTKRSKQYVYSTFIALNISLLSFAFYPYPCFHLP